MGYAIERVIRDIYYNAPVHPVAQLFFLPESKEERSFIIQEEMETPCRRNWKEAYKGKSGLEDLSGEH